MVIRYTYLYKSHLSNPVFPLCFENNVPMTEVGKISSFYDESQDVVLMRLIWWYLVFMEIFVSFKSKKIINILLITLDYDNCSAILTILFEGKFQQEASIRERFVMDNYYNKRGSLKSIELR